MAVSLTATANVVTILLSRSENQLISRKAFQVGVTIVIGDVLIIDQSALQVGNEDDLQSIRSWDFGQITIGRFAS